MTMTPAEKDAMALAVVRSPNAQFASIADAQRHYDSCAYLAARIAELEAENERAWAAANRADAKVRGWEATVVCTGLPFRACPVDGWGPGADGTVEVPALTTEKLTSILDRLARAEAELAAVLKAADYFARNFSGKNSDKLRAAIDAARGGE